MENTMHIVIDFKNVPPLYPYITNNRDNYSSDLSYKSHINYFKSKSGNDNPAEKLLEGLTGGFVQSGFDAIQQVLFNREIKRIVDNAVRKAVEATGGKWTDD